MKHDFKYLNSQNIFYINTFNKTKRFKIFEKRNEKMSKLLFFTIFVVLIQVTIINQDIKNLFSDVFYINLSSIK